MGFKLIPELPLFRRELTELANRRRTYIIRTFGAIVLCILVFITYGSVVADWERSNMGRGANRYLGIGGWVFAAVVPLLFRAIQILLPALCCASITTEKEQNTIGTLFLTRLSPWTIVFEKLLSRIVPMVTILLLSAPILTYVYSLGGVDLNLLLATFWLLFCECLLIASIAIACSSWFSTTVSAFIWSYSLIACLAVVSAAIGAVTLEPVAIWEAMFETGVGRQPGWMRISQFAGGGPATTTMQMLTRTVLQLLLVGVMSIPSMVMSMLCLTFARVVLIRRAFVSHSSVLLKVFHAVDRFFTRLNERTTGGIELIPDSNPLPEDDPVAWRERTKKSLGKARYLFRMLLFLEGPTVFICIIAAQSSARSAFAGLYVLQGLLWALAAMITAVKGATLFASERARETIEPLLASPLSVKELISQKISGSRRLIIALAIPLLTVNLTHLLLNIDVSVSVLTSPLPLLRPLAYLVFSGLLITAILYLIVWISMAVGLKVHSQTRAVLGAVVLVGLWGTLPIGLSVVVPGVLDRLVGHDFSEMVSSVILLFSPASCVIFNESFLTEPFVTRYSEYSRQQAEILPTVIPAVLSIGIYWMVLLLIRRGIQAMAPAMLNRREGQPATKSQAVPAPSAMPAAEG
jgi:ABC-type transport system involved in multi-copper enzyme maturation permease subunit